MRILSLFDGMACGMLAMQSSGIKVDRYVAFEIDKYAVQTSSHNFPMIEHRGDVFHADFTEFSGFDFLVGGSPCTYWSIAQKNNRETEASGMGWELFSQYVRALREAQPMYFIYENNKSMANAIRESITETFGFEPICINSALVSAQNRQRLYWVGKRNPDGTYSRVKVDQPEDRGILLRDVLDGMTDREKGRCVLSSIGRTTTREYFKKDQGTMAFEPVAINTTAEGDKARTLMAGYYKYGTATLITNEGFTGGTTAVAEPVASTVLNVNPSGKGINGAVGRIDAKSRCLTTNKGEGQKIIVPVCVAQRGRYADTGKRSVKGNGEIEQFYEAREDGKTNTLTTVQKDNNVCEPVRIGCYPSPDGTIKNSQGMRLYSIDGKSVNMTALGGGLGAKSGLYAIQCCPMNVREATAKGYTEINPDECVDMTQPNSKTRRGRNMADKSNCLMTSCQYYQYCGVLGYATPCEWDDEGRATKAISGADGKIYPVYEVNDGQITIRGKQYPIKLVDGYYIIRKLTVSECKRLQTVPEWYEFPVSDSQAYKMLGNGWTVEVIAHLINATQTDELEETEEQLSLFK